MSTADVPVRYQALIALMGLMMAVAAGTAGSTFALSLAAAVAIAIAALSVPARLMLLAAILLVPLSIPVVYGDRSVLVPPSDFVLLPLGLAVFLATLLRRQSPLVLYTDLFFAGYLVFAVLSMAESQNLFSFAFSLKVEVVAYLTFRLTVALIDTPAEIRQSFVAVLFALLLMSTGFFLGFISAYNMGGLDLVFGDRGSLRGSFGADWAASNTLAAHLALALPAATAVAFLPGTALLRLLAGTTALGGIAGVFLTSSRGAILAMTVAAAIFLWINRRRSRVLLVAIPAGLSVLLALALYNPVFWPALERFETVLVDPSSQARLAMWTAHAQAILERPFIGHGLDNTGLPFSTSTIRGEADAHNFILKTAVQVGLFGLFFKLALLGFYGAILWKRRTYARQQPVLYGAFLAIYVGSLTNAMVESVFSGDRFGIIFMHCMGLLVAWDRWLRNGSRLTRAGGT